MKLTEQVALAMAERRVPGSTNDGLYQESAGWRAVLEMDAQAAIAVVREEAARIADGVFPPEAKIQHDAAKCIVAALRRMGEG